MSDSEIEKTLREIRDRVRVQIRSQLPAAASEANGEPIAANLATIESLKANLSVVERSWNRLPPITSYRRGPIARFELWLKRSFRKITHWYTWEQVNFNSATANSLKEIQGLLSAHEEALREVRDQLERIANSLGTESSPYGAGFSHSIKKEQTRDAETSDDSSQSKIDLEISTLNTRLKELRAIKSRLEGLDDRRFSE